MSWRHRDILEAELHEPKGFTTANNGDSIWRNEKGTSEWTDREVLPAALNFVDASVAPPTTATGDIYVLSLGASIHANWGTVALKDWVRYDGTSWQVITPSKSILCYDKTLDVLMSYDGSVWNAVGGGDNIANANLTFDGSYYADLNDNSWQLKDSTGANRLLLDVQQGNANGHGIGYGGDAVDGKHTFYNTATNGTQALGQMSFLNGLKLSNGSLEQDYLNFGSGGFLLHIKSHVSYGSSIGVYPDITLRTRHSSTGIVLDTNNFTSFKKNTVEHSRIDSSSRWILKGSAVVGSEKISLQDDTLVKGSDNSEITSGFKVTDVNDDILYDIRNNGQAGYGGAYLNTAAHVFRNPNNEATILSVLNGTDEKAKINSSGHLTLGSTAASWQHRFRAQSGVGYIELRNTSNVQYMSLQTGNNGYYGRRININDTTAAHSKAVIQLNQSGSIVSQQLFFANITTTTAGRLGSSTAFGAAEKGFECFDTTLNKKFIWNGSAWEQITSV